MKIVVVGSVALDTIKTPFGKGEEILGGSATHFSLAAGFFTDVGLVAVVGEDFPEQHLEFLRNKGIDLAGLEVAEGRTFRWEGYYEYDLSQAHTLDTQLNVFENFEPQLPPAYRDAKFLFLANIDPELQRNVLRQARNDVFSVCDTMNFWIDGKREALDEIISRVNFCLMNESEAREYCGTFSLIDSARQILAMGPQAVILKKGEHGALLFMDENHFSAPAFPLEEIRDPTGAGDSFAGGFLGYLANAGEVTEAHVRRAVIYGSVMASFNVEGFGTERIARLTREEIDERFQVFRQITHF